MINKEFTESHFKKLMLLSLGILKNNTDFLEDWKIICIFANGNIYWTGTQNPTKKSKRKKLKQKI